MKIEVKQYVELRGSNPLKAVVSGTESNAHLVATSALIHGVSDTADQYHISEAEVYGALAFYHENKILIEKHREESDANIQTNGISSKDLADQIRKRGKS